MVWIFLIAAILAFTFMLLGAMTVWVSVLSLALKAVMLVGIVYALYILYRQFKRRRQQ